MSLWLLSLFDLLIRFDCARRPLLEVSVSPMLVLLNVSAPF